MDEGVFEFIDCSFKMDAVKCILCVNTLDIHSNEFEILGQIVNEMLEVVLLKPNFGENINPVICRICKENLHKSFAFKATCIDTEDCLFPYINSSTEEINLTFVYVRERTLEKSFKFGENDEVCRFCLSLTKINTATTLISEILNYGNFFGNFMPEIDLKAAGKALVCESCHVSLEKYVNFIKSCLEKGSQIMKKGCMSNLDTESKTNLARLKTCNEEIKKELMFDENFSPLKTEQDTDIDEIPLAHRKETAMEKSDEDKNNPLTISKLDMYNDSIYIGEIDIKLEKSCESGVFVEGIDRKENIWQILSEFVENPSVTQEEMSVNEVSDYQIQMKDVKKLLYKDISEIEMFKCALCSYETKKEYDLKSHMINHKKLSDLRMYKCEICNYPTKKKNTMKQHMLIHKDVSDIKMYKCEMCDYQARQKSNLKAHLLVHKNPSDIKMYKCEVCNYEVKYKGCFKSHSLIHQKASDIKMYKCEICNYQTKRKNMKRHMLIHKDVSEIEMFKCALCSYETKQKYSLERHMITHKKLSDIRMYKCEICNYQTKWKNNMKSHMLIHKDLSDIKIYKCENCNYQAKQKSNLRRHLLIHKNPSNVEMYKCEVCNYEVNQKCQLKRHSLIHQKVSDVKMYKCELCNYQ